MSPLPEHPAFRSLNLASLERSAYWSRIPEPLREGLQVVGRVLPFRVNSYVLDELIDWAHVPDDPMFRLLFHDRRMLAADDYEEMRDALLGTSASAARAAAVAARIRSGLNPHPAGQTSLNLPRLNGRNLPGLQWKYSDTVLYFPSAGQVCHAYCTFCFRWPQFVGEDAHRFQSSEVDDLRALLRAHSGITDVLVTGGDPLVMKTSVLARYLDPLLADDLPGLQNIRLGTKSLSYWPARFVTDPDADDLLRLFERIVDSGRHLALMAHFNHPVELETPLVQEALRRIQRTGTVIRLQAPLLRGINDAATTWQDLCARAVQLGIVPYYLFVERDTGPRHYFEVPLHSAVEIYANAMRSMSGLGRTLRGPTMSCTPGKLIVDGVVTLGTEKAFVLRYLRARDPALTQQPFFARYSSTATWADQLEPLTERDAAFLRPVRKAAMSAVALERT